ncbi:MAG: type VI secretion system contractile sheath large subunit, partial [Thermodesulfobacteriota bacterium]|nr:type VI secretion system contractile sheath large subunit [Thermodesulfobacteriota bacterium]
GIRLKIMPVSPENLESVLEKIIDELVTDLPNLVLIDLPFDSSPKSTNLLKKVAVFADTMLVPTLCWIDARFFHLDNWNDLKKVSYLKHYLEDAAYAKWRKLKELPGADWLSFSCNRFLTRFPYGPDNNPGTVFFQEKELLWISPIWALGTLTAQSIAAFGWPCRFTDYTSINLKDLAVVDSGDERPMSTEMSLSEDRLMEFIEIGITPLQGVEGKDIAFTPRETTLAGGSLKYQFFISRILTFLWWYRDNMDEELMRGDLGTNIKNVLELFWRRTGHAPPEDMEFTAEVSAEDKPVPIRISMTPPPSILPGGRKLEMTFLW